MPPPVVLSAQRGCVIRDTKLGLIFLSEQQLKTSPDRRDRTPETIPWVINEFSAPAIEVLEDLVRAWSAAVRLVLFRIFVGVSQPRVVERVKVDGRGCG